MSWSDSDLSINALSLAEKRIGWEWLKPAAFSHFKDQIRAFRVKYLLLHSKTFD